MPELVRVGDVVWATIRGYPSWPAKVMGIRGVEGNIVDVLFFGTLQKGSLKATECSPFDPCTTDDPRLEPKRRMNGFDDALDEARDELKPAAKSTKASTGAKVGKSATAAGKGSIKLASKCGKGDPSKVALRALCDYLQEHYGGHPGLLKGWTYAVQTSADNDVVTRGHKYKDPNGRVHRSRIEVARALGLTESQAGAAKGGDDSEGDEADEDEALAGETLAEVPEVPEVRDEDILGVRVMCAGKFFARMPLRRSGRERRPLLDGSEEDDVDAFNEVLPARAVHSVVRVKLTGEGMHEAARPARGAPGGERGGRTKRSYQLTRNDDQPPLRNPVPEAIATHGFAECSGLLPVELCARIAKEPMEEAEGISNAFQKNLDGALLHEVEGVIGSSPSVRDAIQAAFGVTKYAVKTVKVLMTEFCAAPQIPHADDFCNRELFGIAHLLPDQPQTECLEYDGAKDFPTGVAVECDACSAWIPLPDRIARRRDHLRGRFICEAAGRTCQSSRSGRKSKACESHKAWAAREAREVAAASASAADQPPLDAAQGAAAPATTGGATPAAGVDEVVKAEAIDEEMGLQEGAVPASDGEESKPAPPRAPPLTADYLRALATEKAIDDPFAINVCLAFKDLLNRPDETVQRMRPMGPPPKTGDAVVGLPTLIHRGPGGNDVRATDRWVLFFTCVPVFDDDDNFEETLGEYDPEAQIHAGWLLWRAGTLLGER